MAIDIRRGVSMFQFEGGTRYRGRMFRNVR